MEPETRRIRTLIDASNEGAGPEVAREAGLTWEATRTAGEFLEGLQLQDDPPAFVLLSCGVPSVDQDFVARVHEVLAQADGAVFLSSPRASLEWAVVARRLGSGPLLGEPLSHDELTAALRRSLAKPEGVRIPRTPEEGQDLELVGSGPAMMEIVRSIAQVGDTPATVLITGESGTGKELVARALHRTSGRHNGPFVSINCAAIPENLLESEFFGHERGAFTGAVARKQGRFERADGGTLFLDEIGDMSLVLQAKLLRVLEERVIERVGGETPIAVDVRIVAATNHRIEDRVTDDEFREDLYYRIAAARIHLPPLRERREDLEELVFHFVRTFAEQYQRPVQGISTDAMRLLAHHAWPGNIRELRNVLDRAVLNSRGGWIQAEDLRLGEDSPRLSSRDATPEGGYPPTFTLESVERDHIARVLTFTGGAMAEAADILGIHRNTLTRKVTRYGLDD